MTTQLVWGMHLEVHILLMGLHGVVVQAKGPQDPNNKEQQMVPSRANGSNLYGPGFTKVICRYLAASVTAAAGKRLRRKIIRRGKSHRPSLPT